MSGAEMTLNAISAGDTFKVGNYTYEKIATGFIRVDANGGRMSWANAAINVEDGVTYNQLLNLANWTQSAAVGGDLIINSSTQVGEQVDRDDSSKIYGVLEATGSGFLLKNTNKNTDPASITVEDVTLTIELSDSDALGYDAVPFKLSNATVNTPNGHKISGTVDSVAIGSLTVTPVNGDVFDVDDTDYRKTGAGLIRGDKIWHRDVSSYTLPGEEDRWHNLLKLTNNDTTLNLSGVTGNGVVVTDDLSTRKANLTYNTNSDAYTLSEISANSGITDVELDAAKTNFSTTFATTVTTATGTGTYTINGNSYTGSRLTVAATATNSSTLTAGTVYALAGQTVTVGEHVLTPINVADNAIISLEDISGLSVGDTFALDGDTYTYVDTIFSTPITSPTRALSATPTYLTGRSAPLSR